MDALVNAALGILFKRTNRVLASGSNDMTSVKVIVDHFRAAAFLISDGVIPR
jgi:alanyl-tRNA synthetase